MRALFDTDVLLDVLLDREPFSEASAQALSLAERGIVRGYVCATSITTVFYLLRKALGKAAARRHVASLMALLEIAPVSRSVLDHALGSRIADFEDAVVAAAALAVDVDLVVTRNVKDYKRSQPPAAMPAELLAVLAAASDDISRDGEG